MVYWSWKKFQIVLILYFPERSEKSTGRTKCRKLQKGYRT